MKRSLLLVLLVASVLGLVGIFSTKFPPLSKKLDGPQFCGGCHIMKPWVNTYIHSAHSKNSTCGDCHIPHNIVSGSFYKAYTGSRDGFYMVTGRLPENIQISSHGAKVVNDNCYRCHKDVMSIVGFPLAERNKNCFDCHRNEPHNRLQLQKEGRE